MTLRSTPLPRAGQGGGGTGAAVGLGALILFTPVAAAVAAVTMVGLARQGGSSWLPARIGGPLLALVVAVELVAVGNPLAIHYAAEGLGTWFSVIGLAFTVPLGVPVGLIAGSVMFWSAEYASGGAEWHPLEQRRRAVQARSEAVVHASLLHDQAAQSRCSSPPLGVARDGDLDTWREGPFVVIPASLRGLGLAVVGASGSGKTVTLERKVAIDARAGRKVVLADCKGSDPDLPERVVSSYVAARPGARVLRWPAEPLDMWRGSPGEVVNRLILVSDWSEPYYKQVTQTAIRLALGAPDVDGRGPCRSSTDFLARLEPKFLTRAYEGTSKASDVAALVRRPENIEGVRLRYSGFFDALDGRFDGESSFEDCDLVVMSVPTLAAPEDADATVRMLLADYGHYAMARKPRRGEDSVVTIDEFSAVTAAAPLVINLAERVRDVGGQVVVVAQGFEGLGTTPDERSRLLRALAGGLILHRCDDPDELLKAAGTVRKAEQSWQLDEVGGSGMGSLRMGFRMRVDADAVRQARVGEAWVISGGRSLHMNVIAGEGGPRAPRWRPADRPGARPEPSRSTPVDPAPEAPPAEPPPLLSSPFDDDELA